MLFYRLNVISIYLPPLRDRRDDIPLLVEHFVDKHRYAPGAAPSRVSQPVMDLLMEHDWPGNIRELENIIERAVVISHGSVITADHISFHGTDNRRIVDIGDRIRRGTSLNELLTDIERAAIAESLGQNDGDRVSAASQLGLEMKEFNQRAKLLDL